MATTIEPIGGSSTLSTPPTAARMAPTHDDGRLAAMADGCPDALARLTLNGHFTDVNPAMERIVGWRADVIRGRSILALAHPSDRPGLEMRLGRLLSNLDHERPGAAQERILFRARRVDAHYSWLEARLRIETGERGGVLGLIGSLRDVDGQQQEATAERHVRGGWAALAHLGQVIAGGGDRAAILKEAAARLLGVLPARAILVVEAGEGGGHCTTAALREPVADFAPERCLVPHDGDTPAARALREGTSVVAPLSEARSMHGRRLARLWHSAAAVPIRVDGRTWGVLVALDDGADGTPDATRLRVMERAAELVGLGIGRP